MSIELTAEKVRELLAYDPLTGVFVWAKQSSLAKTVKVGNVAGYQIEGGYWRIGIEAKKYPAHRLAWLHFYGTWPKHHIDHIDGNPGNNAIANLRDVPQAVNVQNIRRPRFDSRIGLLGVSASKSRGEPRFVARISVGNKRRNLGVFETPEEAHVAYLNAKRQLHAGCTI